MRSDIASAGYPLLDDFGGDDRSVVRPTVDARLS